MLKHLSTLDKYGFIMPREINDADGIVIRALETGWHIMSDIFNFTKITNLSLEQIIVETRVDLLD